MQYRRKVQKFSNGKIRIMCKPHVFNETSCKSFKKIGIRNSARGVGLMRYSQCI